MIIFLVSTTYTQMSIHVFKDMDEQIQIFCCVYILSTILTTYLYGEKKILNLAGNCYTR